MRLSQDILHIDAASEIARIGESLRASVIGVLKRKGLVVGLSGGVDSAVCAALSARALGDDRVLALLMPEAGAGEGTRDRAVRVAEALNIPYIIEDITALLVASGCYERQAAAIRKVFPDYEPTWKFKLSLPSVLTGRRLAITQLVVLTDRGDTRIARMGAEPYQELIAATNFKQRIRTMLEYYHADRLHYAVCGTPNRLEFDQGFFVKNGDGSADVKPIAHLYKSQVYQLGGAMGVPEEVLQQPPSTDTFSLDQTQEEFYFGLPVDRLDLVLYGLNHEIPAADVAPAVGLTAEQVTRVYEDIRSKRRATRYLHLPPLTIDDILPGHE
jgi:NAD+ synthase